MELGIDRMDIRTGRGCLAGMILIVIGAFGGVYILSEIARIIVDQF